MLLFFCWFLALTVAGQESACNSTLQQMCQNDFNTCVIEDQFEEDNKELNQGVWSGSCHCFGDRQQCNFNASCPFDSSDVDWRCDQTTWEQVNLDYSAALARGVSLSTVLAAAVALILVL
mmetsp:Transcript_13476/g.26148  ORF Transcript_13476/g.26148 Transcript_13476/m.26148 type:complete len:120 (+) Transcript_13476:1276-1635(+)